MHSVNKSSETDSYQKLKSWYLARLRKSALSEQAGNDLTPATLVLTDRQSLENLIAQTVQPTSKIARTENQWAPWLFCGFVLLTNLSMVAWIALDEPLLPALIPAAKMVLAILLVLSCIATYFFVRTLNLRSAMLAALRQREEAIADYALDPFLSIDGNYRLIAASPAMQRLLGLNDRQLAGASFLDLLPAPETERVKHTFDNAKLAGASKRVETQIRGKNQSLTDVDLSVDYSVTESTYYCILTDISERKEIERLKDQLTTMLSHDLRTPLTALEFSLALLLKDSSGALTEEGRSTVKAGQNNVTRLIGLINQLLDLYKLEARKLQLHIKDTPFSDVIRATLESIETVAEAKAIDIKVEAEELTITADPNRLTQILINLVANAIKYSPERTTVVISARRSKDNAFDEIRVTDAGPGIAKEHQQSIFERFYMVGADRSGSTGLGLAISKAIIEAHGGTIGVDSEPGQGASFWVRLPLHAGRPRIS